MKVETLQEKFKKMGAGFKLIEHDSDRRRSYSVDVSNKIFSLAIPVDERMDIDIIDQDVKDRHLVLNVRRPAEEKGKITFINEKWLCGHDERDWFVGAVGPSVLTVKAAKESLKPKEVVELEKVVRKKAKHKRKNKARLRQGEWFFVPVPDLVLPKGAPIHKDEPISRGRGSKPHTVEEVYRIGGKQVWVRGERVYTDSEYEAAINKGVIGFQRRTADAQVYGRGYVKHKDHATIYLDGWHKILMNTERASEKLMFID